MIAWLKYTRTALVIAAVCLGGLSLNAGCHKGDEGEDRGSSAKDYNKEKVLKPIQDKPVGEGQ